MENRSQDDIKKKEGKISDLLTEENDCMNRNERLNDELKVTQQEIEEFSDSSKKLREFGNIRGKLSQKISTLVKEHKFFNDNTVYSTCNQDIEESFRVNRIEDSHNKAKDLQEGYQQLLDEIKKEEERESHFKTLNGYLSTTLNEITSNNSQIASCQRQVKTLESEIQRLTSQLADRNTEHSKLEEFRENLQSTYEELRKEEKISPTMTLPMISSKTVESRQRSSRSIFLSSTKR